MARRRLLRLPGTDPERDLERDPERDPESRPNPEQGPDASARGGQAPAVDGAVQDPVSTVDSGADVSALAVPPGAAMPAPRAGSDAPGPVLTLYRRAGCHLCEDLEATLLELVDPASFVLRSVDIDTDPVLRERFNEAVPVLMHREHELCRYFLDLEAVQQLLAGYNNGI